MKQRRLTGDFESRSMADLKKIGAYNYSMHPSTQPTCFAFKFNDGPTVYFLDFKLVNTPWAQLPERLKLLWAGAISEGVLFVAQNAYFETCLYKNIMVRRYGWPDIPFRQFRCTAAKAAACALPRNLAGAGEAMNLSIQKDKRGYVAMMGTCKPTRQWNAWKKANDALKSGARISAKKIQLAQSPEPPVFLSPEAAPEVWDVLYTYCKIDVRTEEKLDEALPDLIPFEQEIWFLNQQINWRGLRIDIPTVRKISGIMEAESEVKLKELDALTMGLVTKPGARKSILEFLEIEGVTLPDIRANTVSDVLEKGGMISEDARRLLEIRKALSKTSTRKYQSFLNRAAPDNHVRDILLYHGAGTGRDTGAGVQPQNFPSRALVKSTKERPYAAVENVIECDADELRMLYGDNLSFLFSSVLRNMILPGVGDEMFVADFSKIEVAVCWWMAGNTPGLKILNSGKDPYKYQAAANTGKTYDEIGDEGPDRQLGKAQILGCQFGMGWEKFQSTAWDQYRLKLSEEQSRHAVNSYREANAAVPQAWKDAERAAVMAIEDGATVTVGKCTYFVKDKFLWMRLPSGRCLAYREPSISWRETDYGPRKQIEFWGVNSKTKKWSLERTWGGVLWENAVQATARELMKHGELLLEKAGYKILLTCHDEILSSKKAGTGRIEEFVKIMCTRPAWADELLLIEAKGWVGPRYRK